MKKIAILTQIIIMPFIFFFNTSAETIDNHDYGAGELIEALPGGVADELTKSGITPNADNALNISVGDVLEYAGDLFMKEIKSPLKLMSMLIGVIMLSALAEALRDSANGGAAETFRLVSVICCAGMMSGYIAACVTRSCDILTAGVTFFNIFVPIFAGIMAVSGKLASASVFCGIIIVSAQMITQFMMIFLIPLSTSLFGLSIAGAVNPEINIDKVSDAVKKIVTWTLGIAVTVFVGLLSIQSFIAGAADSVTLRAVKFAVSNSVPVIGSAVSDALATVKSSIGLLQSTTGVFGIIALAVTLLPPIVSIACYRIVLSVSAAISEMFGVGSLTKLLKSGENALAIVFSMLAAFVILTVVSTSLMLMINGGAG